MIKSTNKSKLTLWIPQDVKEFGKRWSKGRDQSLSELFTGFLKRLKASKDTPSNIPPIIKEITGMAKGYKKPKKTYAKHLDKKYS